MKGESDNIFQNKKSSAWLYKRGRANKTVVEGFIPPLHNWQFSGLKMVNIFWKEVLLIFLYHSWKLFLSQGYSLICIKEVAGFSPCPNEWLILYHSGRQELLSSSLLSGTLNSKTKDLMCCEEWAPQHNEDEESLAIKSLSNSYYNYAVAPVKYITLKILACHIISGPLWL